MFKEIKIVPYDEKYDKVYIALINENILEKFKYYANFLKEGFPNDIYQIAFNDTSLSMLVITYKNKFSMITAFMEEVSKEIPKPSREELKQTLKEQFKKTREERQERNMDIFLDALLDGLEKKKG